MEETNLHKQGTRFCANPDSYSTRKGEKSQWRRRSRVALDLICQDQVQKRGENLAADKTEPSHPSLETY